MCTLCLFRTSKMDKQSKSHCLRRSVAVFHTSVSVHGIVFCAWMLNIVYHFKAWVNQKLRWEWSGAFRIFLCAFTPCNLLCGVLVSRASFTGEHCFANYDFLIYFFSWVWGKCTIVSIHSYSVFPSKALATFQEPMFSPALQINKRTICLTMTSNGLQI